YDNFVNLSATVMIPEDSTYGPFQGQQNKIYGTGWGRIVVTVNDDETNMHIRISDRKWDGTITDDLATGVWKMILTGNSGRVEGWLYESTMNAQITSEVDYSTLINEPGNARFCITVGSYISRLEWPHQLSKTGLTNDLEIGAISDFSSPGPIRNGSSKPDIVAPGEYIVSSFSSDGNYPGPEKLTPDGLYRAWEGTSMAAPHVTGVIALMFQADPELSTSEIKTIFMNTAKKDDFTGYEPWDSKRGYGKLDALEALRKTPVRDGEGSLMPESIALSQNYPNPFNGSTLIEYTIPDRNGLIKQNVILELFDMSGRKVRTLVRETQTSGHFEVFWEGLDDQGLKVSSGIYVYQLRCDHIILSKKLIYLR
ncbi:S8 family serine peptidase, partial [bacterium]|nr:S8 family serine peptidase [bacterium]